MTESAIKSNQREAQQLFTRGVASARSGQKRMAVVLLSRAVQLDPHHEQAWLWLAGVLDEPERVAFCLRSVLSINPHNERAIKGLAWLEQRSSAKATPAPVVLAPALPVADAPASEPAGRLGRLRQLGGKLRRMPRSSTPAAQPREHDSWWIGARRTRRELNRAWVLVWSTLIVVWLLLIGLNYTLRQTVETNIANAQANARAAALAAPVAVAAAATPVLETNTDATQNAAVLAYLSAIEPPREQLRATLKDYRAATDTPGGRLVTHAAAARAFRDELANTYDALAAVTPPATLEQAHDHYLAGLKHEQTALDDMLEFYGSFEVRFMNRATVRLLDASTELDRAKSIFQHYEQQANDPARRASFTAR